MTSAKGWWVVGLVLLLASVGCTPEGEVPSTPSTRPTTTSVAAPAPLSPAERAARCGDRDQVDEGGAFDYGPRQPRYDGPGPHPAIAAIHLRPADIEDGIPTDLTFDTGELPKQWAPAKSGDRFDTSRAQLMICLTGARERGNSPIGVCKTNRGDFDIYAFRYTISVYETRTAREVATMTVNSDLRPAEKSCPAVITYDAMRGYVVAQDIARPTLKKRLGPHILRTIR